jgi:SNF2 family DNA or RNA helicase
MKTKAMAHQVVGVERLAKNEAYFALGAEQGTGKTWMLIADAEAQHAAGKITGMLVITKRGVHTNWVRRELPIHMSTPHKAEAYRSGAGKKLTAALEALSRPQEDGRLAIVAINIDAMATPKGFAYAMSFVRRHRAMVVVDESQVIKNPASKRSQNVIALRDFAVSRRIASGTLVDDKPTDLFNQYEFLKPGLLGTRSYLAFVSAYAEVLPPDNPLVEAIARKNGGRSVQVIARDFNGNPKWRNLDRLRTLMAPHTFRVLKSDCLDLPPKVYQTHFFDLLPEQRLLYDQVEATKRFVRADGQVDTFAAMALMMKLRQITSGFVMVDGQATELIHQGARMDALREVLEDMTGQVIIWAEFKEEMRQIADMLNGETVVQYHGGIGAAAREEAVDAFQNGRAKYFVGNPAAGGTGLTLTAAQNAVYYSCDQRLGKRLQSEDRCHRIGTRGTVLYVDLAAVDTIDERIAASLQNKEEVADAILLGL